MCIKLVCIKIFTILLNIFICRKSQFHCSVAYCWMFHAVLNLMIYSSLFFTIDQQSCRTLTTCNMPMVVPSFWQPDWLWGPRPRANSNWLGQKGTHSMRSWYHHCSIEDVGSLQWTFIQIRRNFAVAVSTHIS